LEGRRGQKGEKYLAYSWGSEYESDMIKSDWGSRLSHVESLVDILEETLAVSD